MYGLRFYKNSRVMPPLPKSYLSTSPNYLENKPEPASKAIMWTNIAEGHLDALGACNRFNIFDRRLSCQPLPWRGEVLPHGCFWVKSVAWALLWIIFNSALCFGSLRCWSPPGRAQRTVNMSMSSRSWVCSWSSDERSLRMSPVCRGIRTVKTEERTRGGDPNGAALL